MNKIRNIGLAALLLIIAFLLMFIFVAEPVKYEGKGLSNDTIIKPHIDTVIYGWPKLTPVQDSLLRSNIYENRPIINEE